MDGTRHRLTSMLSRLVAARITGRIKYGSTAVRSGNHRAPSPAMLAGLPVQKGGDSSEKNPVMLRRA